MVFNQTEKQERAYLKQIITLLRRTIGSTDASVKDHIDTLAEYKDYLWSNKDIDPHEIRSMRESILNHFAIGESVIDKRKRLTKILAIPYFGRIDFRERSSKVKVSEKDAFFFLLCRSSIIHFYFKTIFVFLNYLFPRSYPTEISKKEKRTDFFSQFP